MAKAQYDKQQVLQKATSAFWQLGYHATSMQTLVAETGLKPGSLYLAFGNKEGLFKASLDYYAQQSINQLTSLLAQYEKPEDALPKILISFIEESQQADYCSCFLVKSQLELTPEHAELKSYVSKCLRKIENIYAQKLLTTNSEAEAKAKAASLMLHIFGIRVYGYHEGSKADLMAAVHVGLPWLTWQSIH